MPGRIRWPIFAALGLLALGGAILLLTVWRAPVLALFLETGRLEALVRRLGPAGPLAIVGLQIAQVVAAPIPGQVIGLASGYLYGPWLGTLYSMAGLLLGTYLAVWLVRRWGRPIVERLVEAGTLARIDRLSERLGIPVLFLVFLLPFLPDDAILLVAGLTDLPLGGILLAALFGRLPGVLISCWLGRSARTLTAAQWIAIVGGVLLIAAPLYLWRERLQRLAWSLVERVTGRGKEG